MRPVEFEYQSGIAAADQPEYLPLPFLAFDDDPQGVVISCWEFTSEEERQEFIKTGRLYLSLFMFRDKNGSLNPITPSMITPFIQDLITID